MTGERHFDHRSKDPDAAGVSLLGWQNKSGLRKIDLSGDLLHLRVGKPARVGKDSQLIAAKSNLGKHITDKKPVIQLIPPLIS